ncbi:MAG: hypothetical protein QW139_02130, partial [Candidatus Micrarchaeaceae archaeon]
DEALRVVKLFRKRELVAKDIEEYTKKIEEEKKAINEMSDNITSMYYKLKVLLNLHARKLEKEKKVTKPAKKQAPSLPEINLESIAVIKKK